LLASRPRRFRIMFGPTQSRGPGAAPRRRLRRARRM
jgi:hypothetical protein